MFTGIGQGSTFSGPNYDLFYPQHMQPVPSFSPAVTNSSSMMLFDNKDHYSSAPYDIKPIGYPPCSSDVTAAVHNYTTPMARGYENMSNYFASQTGFVHPYNYKSPYSDCNGFSHLAPNAYSSHCMKPVMDEKDHMVYNTNDAQSLVPGACALQKPPFMTSFSPGADSSVSYEQYHNMTAPRECVNDSHDLSQPCNSDKIGERRSA